MSGLIVLLLLLALALGGLWLLGARGAPLTFIAAALTFAAAGDSAQGRPGLGEAPARPSAATRHLPLAKARHALLGQFSRSETWMIIADSYAARGKTEDAVGLLQSGLRQHPEDFALWTGLGNALVDHAGVMTPAAELAYSRAAALAPVSPAPRFFHALGLLRSGQREEARAEWLSLLADAPADAEWRPLVEDGIALLDAPQRSR